MGYKRRHIGDQDDDDYWINPNARVTRIRDFIKDGELKEFYYDGIVRLVTNDETNGFHSLFYPQCTTAVPADVFNFNNRVGNYCRVLEWTFKYRVVLTQSLTAANVDIGPTAHRVILLYDKQTNGAFPGGGANGNTGEVLRLLDPAGTPTSHPYATYELKNRARWIVLYDKIHCLGPFSAETTQFFVSDGVTQDGGFERKDLDLEVVFSGPGAIDPATNLPTLIPADLVTGSFLLCTVGTGAAVATGAANVQYYSSIRYIDC
jgi:hypothetical protein